MKERGTLGHSGNVSWYNHYGKQNAGSLKKLKIELPNNLAIPLLGIYLEKTKTLIKKDTCTPMFIAALFTIAKTWKQPKFLSTDDWLKNMWGVCEEINIFLLPPWHEQIVQKP